MVRPSDVSKKQPPQRPRPPRQRKVANSRVETADVALKMGQIFNDSQSPDKHPSCVQRMNKLQRDCSRTTNLVKEFYNLLKKMIKLTLFAHDSRSPFGNNCIEFVVKYLLNFRQSDDDDEDIEDQRQEFLESVLTDAVIPLTSHLKEECRVNACNFIRYVSEELKEMNQDLFNTIVSVLLQKTADPKGCVRAAAFLALHRFQNASNENDICAQAIYYHLTSDPDPDVRLSCLKVMASSKNSISYFIDATRDIKDLIRKTAYIQIAQKFDIKSFTIEQRLTILKNGLKDRCLAVRKVVESVVINSWLNSMTNPNQTNPKSSDNLVQLLIALDIQTDIDLIEKMVEIHFKSLTEEKVCKGSDKSKLDQLVEDFRQNYLTEQRVFKEELTLDSVEEVFLWRFLCEFCKNHQIVIQEVVTQDNHRMVNNTGEDIDLLTMEVPEEVHDSESSEPRVQRIEAFDTLIPDVPYFCEYLEKYFQYVCTQELTINEALDCEFIFKQLMKISLLLEIGDDAQRYHLTKGLHSILMNDTIGDKFHSYVAPIMKTLAKKAFNDNVAYLDFAAEIISEIYNSIHSANSDETEALHEESVTELEDKKNRLVADMDKYKKQVQDLMLEETNTAEVEELNKKISELQTEVQTINEKIATNTLSQSSMASQTQSMPSLADHPIIQIKCLDILCGCLEFGDFGEVNAVMQNHIEKVCLPGFLSEKPNIRCMATRCLGLFCFVCAQYFKQYLHLMIEIFSKDVGSVKLIALESLFDCLCEHGLNIFGNSKDTDKEPSLGLSADEQKKDFVKQFNDFFDEHLQSDSNEIRQITIQGICKLLLHSKMYSPELLSKLAIIWFTPDENEPIVQLIGEFLRLYSLAESQGVIIGQSALEEAFLITLQTIADNNLKLDSDRLIRIFMNFIKEDNHIKLGEQLCKTLLDMEVIHNNKLAEDYLLSAISQLNLVEFENRDLKRFENSVKQIEDKFANSKSKKVEKKLTLIKNNVKIRGQQLEADSAFAKDFRSDDEKDENKSDDEGLDENGDNFTRIRSLTINDNRDEIHEEVNEGNNEEPTEPNEELNEEPIDRTDNTTEETVPNTVTDQTTDQNNANESRQLVNGQTYDEDSITRFQSPLREPIEEINGLSIESDSEAESYRTCPESPEQKRRRLSSDRRESHDTRDASNSMTVNETAVPEEAEEDMQTMDQFVVPANEDKSNELIQEETNEDQLMEEQTNEDQVIEEPSSEAQVMEEQSSEAQIPAEDVSQDQTMEETIESTTE